MTYGNAPIVEAVLDLHFLPRLTIRDLERLRDRLKRFYPSVEEVLNLDVQLNGRSVSASTTANGFKMTMSSGDGYALLSPSSFTTIKGAPYLNWSNLTEMARNNFKIWSKIVGRRDINRIGTRFTNRFDIKKGETPELFKLLELYHPPKNIDGLSMHFFASQSESTEPATQLTVKVNAGTAQSVLIDHDAYLLDIDVIDLKPPTSIDAIWDRFEEMRHLKNRVFEASITEQMRAAIR